MAQQYGLGRGLSSLIPPKKPDTTEGTPPVASPSSEAASQPLRAGSAPASTHATVSPFVITPGVHVVTPGSAPLSGGLAAPATRVAASPLSESARVVPAPSTSASTPQSSVPVSPMPVRQAVGSAPASLPVAPLTPSVSPESDQNNLLHIALSKIAPNPEQPRLQFDTEKLSELSQSIREHGILQPLVVTRVGENYELIAGERRLQAAKLAGLVEVPVIVRSADERTKLELAIIENTQRHNLNPIEEAKAYLRLIEEYGLHQEEVAKKMGKSRSLVANTVRLLHLPVEIQRALIEGKISEGHAKALLSIESGEKQRALFEMILKSGLTVRETEMQARSVSLRTYTRSSDSRLSPEFTERFEKLREKLGTRVKWSAAGEGGKIVIEYYSPEELKGLFQRFGL